MLQTIMKQNYFQYNDTFFQPEKAIAMGSTISRTMAEIHLQYIGEKHKKHWLEITVIIHYKRYVDDIIIIYDQSKTQDGIILHEINKTHKTLHLKMSTEESNTINHLDINIHRNNNNMDICIYRKTTCTDTTTKSFL